MIKKISIWDLDGTVICSAHRYRNLPCGTTIDLDYWIKNSVPEKIKLDKLLPLATMMQANIADPECYTVVCTARVCQQADYDYVHDNIGQVNKFISRPFGNRENDAKLKIRQLRWLTTLKQFASIPKTMFEDNPHNVRDIGKALNINMVQVINKGLTV